MNTRVYKCHGHGLRWMEDRHPCSVELYLPHVTMFILLTNLDI